MYFYTKCIAVSALVGYETVYQVLGMIAVGISDI